MDEISVRFYLCALKIMVFYGIIQINLTAKPEIHILMSDKRYCVMYDKEKIEVVLAKGKEILETQPKLKEMSIDSVLNDLDDGTQEMIHNRWGVVAWIVVESISDFEIKALVEYLSSVSSGLLTDQYVGYLLQKEYNVDLESLILEADRCEKFDKMINYVLNNIQYKSNYNQQNLLPLLEILEHNYEHFNCWCILNNYTKHIMNCNAWQIVADTLCVLKSQVQYDLMNHLKRPWYQEDVQQANNMLNSYVSQPGIWNNKIAIEFIGESLDYNTVTFEKKFLWLKELSYENSDLWIQMIPVFVKYIKLKDHDETIGNVFFQVLQELERIPNDVVNAKAAFINSIEMNDNLSENVNKIYQEIISKPFEGRCIPFDSLDYYYYTRVKNGSLKIVMQELQTIFNANNYLANYSDFFNKFESTTNEMSKYSSEIIEQAFRFMLSDKIEEVFFGLGLFVKIGNLDCYIGKPGTEKQYFLDVQLVRLMKGLLYYSIDSKVICHTVFKLLALSKEECTQYFQFCMDDVYANYPHTIYNISSKYRTEGNIKQIQLAELVQSTYEKLLDEQKIAHEVRDLQPSYEHQQIYRKAHIIQNREINKKANERSVFADFFQTRVMKYGVRSAYVVTLSKNQKEVRESGYQQITHEMELPMIYVHNPVEFTDKRMKYLEEVEKDAINN